MFIELATTALLEQAWKERSIVAQFSKDLLEAAKGGKFKLFIFGEGGVGKSILGKLLAGELSLETVPPDYDLSLEKEVGAIEGRFFVASYVPPGQKNKRGYAWDELYKEIQTAERYAIINVCAWGYHSLAKLEFKHHKLYRAGISSDEFLKLYLEEQRFAELRALEELVPHLKTSPGKLRMLTLVTKQDLWWTDRSQVKNHYEIGRYSELVRSIEDHKGKANFSHDYISASLNLLNFKTEDNVVLTQTVGGYDNGLRIVNFNNAIRAIRGLIQ
ncbi:hypothetical protein [Bradyrhizobium japonicum]|uniref:hypothetical protein n=1 Tax=Bradyrhizobium japonicum TaxID=375 RepID=UPI000462E099|nr:hypothetical protein [Bradyrhizobium japonicum]